MDLNLSAIIINLSKDCNTLKHTTSYKDTSMKKSYSVTIGNLSRDLPIIKLPSNIKIALFNSLSDTAIIIEAARELAEQMPETIDILLTPEAKSIPLAFELSRRTDLPYVVARKSKKPYMGQALASEVSTITTDKSQHLYIDEKDIGRLKNKQVALVDDVVSTGATVQALKKLVAKAGGTVIKTLAVFTEGDQEKWSDVISLGHLPIFS